MSRAAAIAGLVTGISLSCCMLASGCPARADDDSALTSAGGAPGITLSPSWSRVMPGEVCTVFVMVDDAVDSISCAEFTISFDPGIVSCANALEGSLYVSCQFPTFFDWYMTGTDTVTVTDCPLGYRSFVIAPGVLFALVFESVCEGYTPLRIERGWIYDLDRVELDPILGEEAHIVVSSSTGDETPPAGGVSMSCNPNPFNPSTVIRVRSHGDGPRHMTLDIYDPAGRLVRELHDGPLRPGTEYFEWDGRGGEGRAARSGVYFAVARIDGRIITRKLVLLR